MNAQDILAQSQPQPEATETQSTNDFDAKFKALAAMERKMRQEKDGMSSREKEWEEKSKKLTEYEEMMKLMDENPIEAIKKRKGWGLQEINEFAVKNSSDEDLDPVAQITKNYETKMEQMKKELMDEFENKIKSKEEEYSKKDYEYQINQFKSSISTFLAENKETFEFVNAYGQEGESLVYDVIYTDVMKRKEMGEEDLTPMSLKDASEKVEAYLDSQHQKFLSLNKVRSKFTSSDKFDLGSLGAQSQPRTLNNSFTPKSQSLDQLNPTERKKQAEDLVRSWMR